jgi:hypothetical protein
MGIFFNLSAHLHVANKNFYVNICNASVSSADSLLERRHTDSPASRSFPGAAILN